MHTLIVAVLLLANLGALSVLLRRVSVLARAQRRQSAKLFLSEAIYTALVTKFVDHAQLSTMFSDLDLVDELAAKYAHMLRPECLPIPFSRRQRERTNHCRPDLGQCEGNPRQSGQTSVRWLN